MSEADWTEFFRLIKAIFNLKGVSWQDKARLMIQEAVEHDAEDEFAEVTEWFM